MQSTFTSEHGPAPASHVVLIEPRTRERSVEVAAVPPREARKRSLLATLGQTGRDTLRVSLTLAYESPPLQTSSGKLDYRLSDDFR